MDMVGKLLCRASICAVGALMVLVPSAGAVVVTNDTAIAPGNSGATPSVSPVSVSGQSGTVASVRVALHQPGIDSPGEVDMLLVGPGGQRSIVISDACAAGSFSNATDLTIADGFASLLPNCGTGVTGGTYSPTDVDSGADEFPPGAPGPPYTASFATFVGTQPDGTWTLYTVDDSGGMLMFIGGGWSLDLGITPATTPAGQTPAKKKCKKAKKRAAAAKKKCKKRR
jgi:hypothetical protein